MAYRDYQAPGVNVYIERRGNNNPSKLVRFLPIFFGNGMTSLSRTIETKDVLADVTNFPEISLTWKVTNNFNYQMFKDTDFTLESLLIHREVVPGEETYTLQEGRDYELITAAEMRSSQSRVVTRIKIINGSPIKKTDLLYDMSVKIENTNDDFDLRLVNLQDRLYAREIFGPYELEENGQRFLNDVAVAAEIAFRMGVEEFFYMEVPRNYGQPATREAMIDSLEKLYHRQDAYRVVPLTLDTEVLVATSEFITGVSNPLDRRETVGFVTLDPAEILDMKNMDEIINKVGGFSESLNNERICNIFGATAVELIIGTKRYTLPPYFLTLAVACLDSVVGMSNPLSTREITIFSAFHGPYYRPREWNMLARYGVFILYQPEKEGPIVIRHQLTTKQSEDATYQEYSMVKNFDAVTKRLRDRMAPYAGPMNITDGYLEKMDASFTSAVEEVKQLGWAKDIIPIQPWTTKVIGVGESAVEEKRTLVGHFQLIPVYPGNNLDIHLFV